MGGIEEGVYLNCISSRRYKAKTFKEVGCTQEQYLETNFQSEKSFLANNGQKLGVTINHSFLF